MGRSLDDISVDTDAVKRTADEIRKINNNIQNEFTDVEKAMNLLSKNWNGYAKESVFSTYKSIKSNYQDNYNRNRYSTIEKYVILLDSLVAKGYEKVEKTNKDLAKNYSDSIADLYN